MEFLAQTNILTADVSNIPLGIFGGIAAGVLGKYFYDFAIMYLKATDRSKVAWDINSFFIIVILSGFIALLLYGFVFEKVSKLEDFWLVLSASAQAGFFSQSIIGEIGKKYA